MKINRITVWFVAKIMFRSHTNVYHLQSTYMVKAIPFFEQSAEKYVRRTRRRVHTHTHTRLYFVWESNVVGIEKFIISYMKDEERNA